MLAAARAILRISTFLVPISACLTPVAAGAASLSWTGAVDSDWSNADNWSAASVPSSITSVVIDGGNLPAEVLGGSSVSASDLTVGLDANGALTVFATLHTSSAALGSHAGATGLLDLTGAGASWQNDGTLVVGDQGAGTFTISAGAQYLGDGAAYIGNAAGSAGSIAVNGQSTFTLSSGQPLFIGYNGQGSFDVTSGATASTGDATLGYGAGSTGNASISGSGTSWQINGDLIVGDNGTGTMAISTGATVSNDNATIGLGSSNGTSSLTVSGLGSQWTTSGVLTVGSSGDGALSVYSGATVSSASAIVGRFASGSVTVGGSGSLWDTGALLVGGDHADADSSGADGRLDISTGGEVKSTSAVIADGKNSIGAVTVDGAGSHWDINADLGIGNQGDGSLTVSGEASVSAATATLGKETPSSGSVVVVGSNSHFDINGDFEDGVAGSGSLKVLAGATASTGNASLGTASGGNGQALVSGAGSHWDINGKLEIGSANGGTGELAVSSAGTVKSQGASIAASSGSSGSATVTGSGSSWSNQGTLAVGDAGNGSLDVILGGKVSTANAIIGNATGSRGAVTVTGEGSTLSVDNALTVGQAGDAALTLSGGAALSASSLTISAQTGSTASVNIGSALGQTATGTATLDVDAIHFGSGNGSLVFNFAGAPQSLNAAIDGTGSIYVASGNVTLTGNSSAFSGLTTITGGSLIVDGTLGGTIALSGYGQLGGTGTVGSTIVGAGSTLAPGNNGAGTLTIDGDLTAQSGSTILIEGNGTTSSRIDVTGAANLTGGTLSLVGADLKAFTNYTIISAGNGISGSFDAIQSNYAFVTPVLGYSGNTIDLTLERNGISFATAGANANQRSAAHGIESLGASNALYNAVAVLSLNEASGALKQLAGEIHTSLASTAFDNGRFVRDAAIDRLRGLQGGVANSTAQTRISGDAGLAYTDVGQRQKTGSERAIDDILSDPANGLATFWSAPYGGWTSSDNGSSNTGGILFGFDTMLDGSDWRVGALAGYGRSRFSQSGVSAHADTDNYNVGLYAGRQWGALALRLGGTYTLQSVSTLRDINFSGYSDELRADYYAHTAQVFGELAYQVSAGETRLEPFANLTFTDVRTNAFSERGGAAALSGSADQSAITFATFGVRAEREIALAGMPGKLYGSLGWRHAFGDLDITSRMAFAGGDIFTENGTVVDQDSLVLDAGFDIALSQRVSLAMNYSGSFGAENRAHLFRLLLQARY
ncbi:autotransporter domain-containing protein [Rhizobium sp. P44RR-XXIV]|uniref:autotransporter domain-containing protein n=1 Tax=Rhizobium sp. P44RR-XXIV TaxID=1921145 RepID=UPI00098643BF|nr:autotransporter domain-containing protein [Rhizobium sp. P44RR-XXIV]TIX87227.1 autotransporter domain-containing protein [Rhizobium sp. P44RR-XXIV]